MKKAKLFSSLLRIALGWVFLYQGIVAFRTPSWSVAPFITNAQTFPAIYAWVLQPQYLTMVSIAVKGIFVLVGVLLVVNAWARIASLLGILLMLFFYFPLLHFPYVGTSYYVVDEHAIFAFILAYLFVTRANEGFSIRNMFRFSRY
jgi:thiosulfate dehydrogenase [quinone] large subunit